MERKYPAKLFWFFVLTNFLFHFFYLSVPGFLLCFVGIWSPACLKVGLAILAVDLILSIWEQTRIVRAVETSTHPDVVELMDILSGPEGLRGVKTWADKRIGETPPIDPDSEDM